MDTPERILNRVDALAEELGVRLTVEKWWDNEYGTGYYCRVHGFVHDSPHIRIELVCSMAIDTGKDDVDLFILVNGVRIAPVTDPWHYLHREGNRPFRLICEDMGYDAQTNIETLLLRDSGSVDET